MEDSSDNSNQTWMQDGFNSMQLRRSEMNELIMDYLVHEGFKEAAERFSEEAGIESIYGRLTGGHRDSDSPISVDSRTNDRQNNGQLVTNDIASTTTTNSSQRTNNNNTNATSSQTTTTTATSTSNITNTDEGATPCCNSNNHLNNNSNANSHHQQGTQMNDDEMINSSPCDDRSLSSYKMANDWPIKTETPEMMDKRIEVRLLIEEGNILEAQSKINLYYPELLDNHRDLFFKLQQQHLIELIRQQKINDSLDYVHDQFNVDETKDFPEFGKTMALLAFDHPDKSPYANLLQISHRNHLASELNDSILQETSGSIEATKPRLVTLLKLLLWTQNELERKKIPFPKMTDLVEGTILEPRH